MTSTGDEAHAFTRGDLRVRVNGNARHAYLSPRQRILDVEVANTGPCLLRVVQLRLSGDALAGPVVWTLTLAPQAIVRRGLRLRLRRPVADGDCAEIYLGDDSARLHGRVDLPQAPEGGLERARSSLLNTLFLSFRLSETMFPVPSAGAQTLAQGDDNRRGSALCRRTLYNLGGGLDELTDWLQVELKRVASDGGIVAKIGALRSSLIPAPVRRGWPSFRLFKRRAPNVQRCPHGHVYDKALARCPYCAAAVDTSGEFLPDPTMCASGPPAGPPGAPPPLPAPTESPPFVSPRPTAPFGVDTTCIGAATRRPAPPIDTADSTDKKPPAITENVQFTVYRPACVIPQRWHPLLVFTHLADFPEDAKDRGEHPCETVRRLALDALGERIGGYADLRADTRQPLPREGHVTIVPEAAGLEFYPPSRSFLWLGDVHKEEFQLRAKAEMDGRTAVGRVSVFLGSVLLAEVDLRVRVDQEGHAASSRQAVASKSAGRFRRIFASYSHQDWAIVRDFRRFAHSLGDEYLLDVTHLRAGEAWSERLEKLIAEADVFQLFWSWNSLASPFVTREWRHALTLGRPAFVRPVYWQQPLPSRPEQGLPPEELRRLHFRYIPLGQAGDEAGEDSPPRTPDELFTFHYGRPPACPARPRVRRSFRSIGLLVIVALALAASITFGKPVLTFVRQAAQALMGR